MSTKNERVNQKKSQKLFTAVTVSAPQTSTPHPRRVMPAAPRRASERARDTAAADHGPSPWQVKDSNLRRQSRRIYSPLPLAARATCQDVVAPRGTGCVWRADGKSEE